MKSLPIAGMLCLLTSFAFAGEEALVPVSKDALHFRLEVGAEPGHVVAGWLDRRGEGDGGFDCAVLDLDGDGKPETVQGFPTVQDYRTKANVLSPRIVVDRDDGRWVLDLQYARFTPAEEAPECYIRWSVTKDDFYAWFINGKVRFHHAAEAAAKAPALRLGPPFRFECGAKSRTQGRQALVSVGLMDGNGCTMRLARLGKQEVRPHVRLLREDDERYAVDSAYG